MRKTNRIMFKAVAILLCLVLLTTSIVSSTFAKFAVKKSATTNMTFEKFGVMVTMTVDPDIVSRVGDSNVKWTRWGDTASVTIDNLVMYPGDNFYKAIKFSFLKYTGDANSNGEQDENEFVNSVAQVPVELKVDTNIQYTRDQFKVEKTDFSYLKKDSDYFIPISVRLNAYNVSAETFSEKYSNINVCSAWREVASADASSTVAKCLGRYTDMVWVENTTYAVKQFDVNQPILLYADNATETNYNYQNNNTVIENFKDYPMNYFCMGVQWPASTTYRNYTAQQLDEIGTWLTTHRNITYSITFTVSVEQIIST